MRPRPPPPFPHNSSARPPAFRASTAPGARVTTTDPDAGAGDGHGEASFPTHALPPAVVPAQFVGAPPTFRASTAPGAGRAWGSLVSNPRAAARRPCSRTIRQFVGVAPAFRASTAPGARARPSQTPMQGQVTGMEKPPFRPTRRRPPSSFQHNSSARPRLRVSTAMHTTPRL
ncbi:hypothetical protein K438DRAFT_2001200 [Mycena galopus ATCC 62051]|nr:hypothetical protein K438DRAFT_2001200 [Mycena galopus ATCC 62051]